MTHLILNEDTNRSGAPYVFFSCFFLTGAKKRLLLQALAHAVPAWHTGTAVFSLLRAVRMKEPDSCVQHIASAVTTALCYATLKPGVGLCFYCLSKMASRWSISLCLPRSGPALTPPPVSPAPGQLQRAGPGYLTRASRPGAIATPRAGRVSAMCGYRGAGSEGRPPPTLLRRAGPRVSALWEGFGRWQPPDRTRAACPRSHTPAPGVGPGLPPSQSWPRFSREEAGPPPPPITVPH